MGDFPSFFRSHPVSMQGFVPMRRSLATILLLLLSLPLVAPALGQTAQQRLLLCCRKGGAHHCMEAAPAGGAPALREHCSACPSHAMAGHADTWIAGAPIERTTCDSIAPLAIRQVEAGYRISFHRSRQKRGPPTFLVA
jgi:hypothetical protein